MKRRYRLSNVKKNHNIGNPYCDGEVLWMIVGRLIGCVSMMMCVVIYIGSSIRTVQVCIHGYAIQSIEAGIREERYVGS